MTTHEESLLKQYADIPFLDVNDRIMLVLLNRSVAQMHSDRRYVVQVAVNVLQGSTKKDLVTLVRDTFLELGDQSQDQITFLLPRFTDASTRLDFDESTTWYRLGDAMLDQFEKPPRILGVQCHTLFKKPKASLMEVLANWMPLFLAPAVMCMVLFALSMG